MIRKNILPLIAAAGVVFAVWTVVTTSRPIPAAEPVAEPAQAPFQAYVAGAGIIEASTRNIAVGSPLAGIVNRMYVEVGSRVKAGDPLFKIDDRNYTAQRAVQLAALRTAEAGVKEAEASLADSRSQLALAESVTDKRAISVRRSTSAASPFRLLRPNWSLRAHKSFRLKRRSRPPRPTSSG